MPNSSSYPCSSPAISSSWITSAATSWPRFAAWSALLARGSGICRPYSPDLNPIEQAFAKIKHWMHVAQKRTVSNVWRHIGSLVGTIETAECGIYFADAGYASIKA